MENKNDYRPLADRMRPKSIEAFIGQKHILSDNKPLWLSIEQGNLHSMIFWGPPGTGKTTLARLLSKKCDAQFLTLSAVLSACVFAPSTSVCLVIFYIAFCGT